MASQARIANTDDLGRLCDSCGAEGRVVVVTFGQSALVLCEACAAEIRSLLLIMDRLPIGYGGEPQGRPEWLADEDPRPAVIQIGEKVVVAAPGVEQGWWIQAPCWSWEDLYQLAHRVIGFQAERHLAIEAGLLAVD